jgi:hypothetical protein
VARNSHDEGSLRASLIRVSTMIFSPGFAVTFPGT